MGRSLLTAKPQRKNRIVTRVMGKIDCLTVKADAPVRPLLDTDLRWVLCIASALEGLRCCAISSGWGSVESFQNIMGDCSADRAHLVG
jgi:hypothetical protein